MTAQNDIISIRKIGADLNPARVAAEVEACSTGAKGISYERMRGPQNDEPPAPSTDALDRVYRRKAKDYAKLLGSARRNLEDAKRIQVELCSRLTLEQAQELVEEERGGGTCSNCGHVAEGTRADRLVKGRCIARCYPYWRAHGEERPSDLIELEIERERAA